MLFFFSVEKEIIVSVGRKKILRAMKNGATRFSTIGERVCAGNSATDRVSAFCSLFLRPTFSIEKLSCALPTPRFHARILEFYCHETQLCLFCKSFLSLSFSLSLSLLHVSSLSFTQIANCHNFSFSNFFLNRYINSFFFDKE